MWNIVIVVMLLLWVAQKVGLSCLYSGNLTYVDLWRWKCLYLSYTWFVRMEGLTC